MPMKLPRIVIDILLEHVEDPIYVYKQTKIHLRLRWVQMNLSWVRMNFRWIEMSFLQVGKQ